MTKIASHITKENLFLDIRYCKANFFKYVRGSGRELRGRRQGERQGKRRGQRRGRDGVENGSCTAGEEGVLEKRRRHAHANMASNVK